jgi:hypothetical protein
MYHQLLEDQLLSNQLPYFTSKKHWRMDFYSRRMKDRSTRGRGATSHCVMPLSHEEGLKQHRVHHPLAGCLRWGTQEEKDVIDHGTGISLKACQCRSPPLDI